ncbi:hypothetical protein BKA70DRAFT_1231213 [Coprinopsis sp. MPI-PUGE-AT-0042]|nr:hypothetical protein BKA70DRAFT_1231213 [Coprinopsis sp. MPI-PUGE-AT-0042]
MAFLTWLLLLPPANKGPQPRILQQGPYYSRVWNQLEDDGIDTLLQDCQGMFRKDLWVLEDIAHPWILNLDLHVAKFVALAKDRIYRARLRCLAMAEIARKYANDEQGVALVRFELDDKQQLVLRVVKYPVPPGPTIMTEKLGKRKEICFITICKLAVPS